MDDPQQIICSVQVGNVEVEALQIAYPDYDDSDRERYLLEFRITSRHSCQCRKDMDELPDLLRALGGMLAIVRHNADPHAASGVNLEKLFAALDVSPPWYTKDLET